jgi:hypothetical protein
VDDAACEARLFTQVEEDMAELQAAQDPAPPYECEGELPF